jgi:hypothetical protein
MLISLGMRCNPAGIIRERLKIERPTMVFDWAQMSSQTMLEIIDLEITNIDAYINKYFSEGFDASKRNKIRGDWFPHDFPNDLDFIKEKYIRRTKRFHESLKSNEYKVFITHFGVSPVKSNIEIMCSFIDHISRRTDIDKALFLSINCEDENKKINKNWINIHNTLGILDEGDNYIAKKIEMLSLLNQDGIRSAIINNNIDFLFNNE